MPVNHDPSNIERENLLNEVIASYCKLLDAGQPPDRAELCERYPSLADDLQAFFADLDQIGTLGSQLKRGLASTAPPADQPTNVIEPDHFTPSRQRQEFTPGSILAGKYKILAVKSGGMGRVYIAEDLSLPLHARGRQVAIKSVADYDDWHAVRARHGARTDESNYREVLERFRRESLAWVRLGRHPNIVFAWWVIDAGAKPYLVLEFCDSGDLSQWIADGRVTIPLAVNFALQFCAGMKYAAAQNGIVHRDIKPSNLLVHDGGILKITDFGLAKVYEVNGGASHETIASPIGNVLSMLGAGTPAYMPPEQFESLAHADTRSDIFSFGATLFEMLTSQRVFATRNAYVMARADLPIPAVSDLVPEVPVRLSQIVSRCLAFKPEERYQSFNQLEADLVEVQDRLASPVPLPMDRDAVLTEQLTSGVNITAETYSLISLGEFQAAADCAQRGIEIEPNSWEHWSNKSKALVGLNDYATAHTCSTRAVELNAASANARSNHAWTTLLLGDAELALEHSKWAVEGDPELIDAWLCLGTCQRRLGRLNDALKSLIHARDLGTHDWKTHANPGFCFKDLQRHDEALASLRTAASINPADAEVWFHLGWLLAAQRKYESATESIERSLSFNSRNADVWGLLAVIRMEAEDFTGARAAVERALALDPGAAHTMTIARVLQERLNTTHQQ